ncbi:MAG: hypothetical protein R2828_29800 [Saprospiraceae bacterium]
MKSRERIKLNKVERFNHFGVSIYLLIPIMLFVYLWIENPGEDEYLYGILIFSTASIFIYLLNRNSLFYQEFKAELTAEQFKRAANATATELNWKIVKLEENYVEAIRFREPFDNGSVGEKITIKKTKEKLLINSIGLLEVSLKVQSRKRNRENVNSFLINGANILKGKNAEEIIVEKQKKTEEEFWGEKEWTIGKILMRIVGYGLTIIFLLLGTLVIYEGEWEGMFPIILSIGISMSYIKNDIQIILEKNRRKKLKKSEPAHNKT